MTIRRFLQVVYGSFFVLAVAQAVLAAYLLVNQRSLHRSQRVRFQSYLVADELRQSSDDLTRFARTYVATGDPKYEQYYWDVLAIRNGDKPRPISYNRIYWDLVAGEGAPPRPDARAVPLRQLMLELGFSDEEFAQLRLSQIRSDALVRTERTAMRAMKGQFDGDSLGRPGVPDQALAIRLMHDSAYQAEKARVMRPLDDFFALLDARTAANTDKYERRGGIALAASSGLVVAFLGLTLLSFMRMRRRVYAPVAALQHQTQMVAADLDRLAAVATDIAGGNLSRSFEGQTAPLGVRGRDEVGQLARLHDSMAARLQEAGAAIAGMTSRLRGAHDALEERNRALDVERSRLLELTDQLTQANEELKRLSEAKSEFVAAASHDLRTPLTTIMESIRLAEDGALGPLSADLKEYLGYAREDALRLRDLINNLLDVSKIERGKMEAKPARVGVAETLKQAAARFGPLAREKGLELACEPVGPDLAVWCDPAHYQRVITNLLSNAVKFTPAGGRVTLRAVPERAGVVRITVEDTGIGIPRDQQYRVFQKFEQIERPGAELLAGTGLGLALCRQLVEMNHGTIGFESEENRGSAFFFTLPAQAEKTDKGD